MLQIWTISWQCWTGRAPVMSQAAALTQGQDSVPPCTFPKREEAAPSTSPGDAELRWVVWRGRWHSSLIRSTCSIHSLPFTVASKQELGPKTGPEKFLCHLLPCPSTQLPKTHGKISQCPVPYPQINTSIHIQRHHLKHRKTKQYHYHPYRQQISSISQTSKARAQGEILKVILSSASLHHRGDAENQDCGTKPSPTLLSQSTSSLPPPRPIFHSGNTKVPSSVKLLPLTTDNWEIRDLGKQRDVNTEASYCRQQYSRLSRAVIPATKILTFTPGAKTCNWETPLHLRCPSLPFSPVQLHASSESFSSQNFGHQEPESLNISNILILTQNSTLYKVLE